MVLLYINTSVRNKQMAYLLLQVHFLARPATLTHEDEKSHVTHIIQSTIQQCEHYCLVAEIGSVSK